MGRVRQTNVYTGTLEKLVSGSRYVDENTLEESHMSKYATDIERLKDINVSEKKNPM